MKFVAKRDFLNSKAVGLLGFTDAAGNTITPLKNHVPKGARFEIGPGIETLKELNADDQLKVVSLWPGSGANCIVPLKNEAEVKKIDLEVADTIAKKAAAKAATPPTLSDVMGAIKAQTEAVKAQTEAVTSLLNALAAAKPLKQA